MKKVLVAVSAAAILVASASAVTACDYRSGHRLSDWDGAWNSLHTYLNDEGLNETYATLAEREGTTLEAVKEAFVERYACEIMSMKIDGDTIVVYSKTQGTTPGDADVINVATYAFVEEMETEEGYTWFYYESEDEDALYPVMLLLPVGEDEPGETMRHFHFLFGDDAEELFELEGLFPTMVKSDSTIDLIANDFLLEEEEED